jgi:hypothetical protein
MKKQWRIDFFDGPYDGSVLYKEPRGMEVSVVLTSWRIAKYRWMWIDSEKMEAEVEFYGRCCRTGRCKWCKMREKHKLKID